MGIKLTNNAASTLLSDITASDTTLTLPAATGDLFPVLGAGDYFNLTVISSAGAYEIMQCTARAGDVLTVVRAQEGTTAAGFVAGSRVELRVTVANVRNIVDELDLLLL